MAETLQQVMQTAAWVAKELFDRNKTTGSSANMSFLYNGSLYITKSGGCFGNLDEESWAEINDAGECVNGKKPSKELPLHRTVYKAHPDVAAVIHVHSPYAVLWSSIPGLNPADAVPEYTPYLNMKLGKVPLVRYAKPGSAELFEAFEKEGTAGKGALLAHHGPVVGGKNLMDAFYSLEELEESCHIAWEIRTSGIAIPTIPEL